jgi:hypothetical protein
MAAYKIKYQRVTENEVVIEADSQEEAVEKFTNGEYFGEHEVMCLGEDVEAVIKTKEDPAFQLSFGF